MKYQIKYLVYRAIEFLFKVIFQNWKVFYAWYLNRQDKNKSAISLKKLGKLKFKKGFDKGLYDTSMGDYHKQFLLKKGLKRDSLIFDLGFGFGRTAIPLIKFLDKGKYIGSEISSERHRIAMEWLEIENLKSKDPKLVIDISNKFAFIENHSLDFVWAQSVFTHLPKNEAIEILEALKDKLKKKGQIIFNFSLSDNKSYKRTSIKDFSYSTDYVTKTCEMIGYHVRILDDWQMELDPRSRAKHNLMLRLTKSGK